jgi:hypothetical protein
MAQLEKKIGLPNHVALAEAIAKKEMPSFLDGESEE